MNKEYMDNLPKATSRLATWLYYLEHLHPQNIELGLNRIKCVATSLDLLKPASLVFTVAGTNGKGTTCRVLETILIEAGYRVGVYSSPHLMRYTERVRIQGKELAESAHTTSFAIIENGRGATSLTYFEYGTLSALWLFKQAHLDVVILEVGLGGRLDATNIVDADIAVITSIALDHTDWLGLDRESIGREKAGIFRKGKSAVVGEPEIPKTITEVATGIGAVLLLYGRDWSYTMEAESWSFQDVHGNLYNLPLPKIPLSNAATALAALRTSSLVVDETVIRTYLPLATLPGRFQTVRHAPRVILDVAHNPHAASYLSGQLSALTHKGKIYAVIGMLNDKDIAGTLACLSRQVNYWYCASLAGPRGASAKQLMENLDLDSTKEFFSVRSAYRQALSKATVQDIVLVCGSFNTVAQVMEIENGIG